MPRASLLSAGGADRGLGVPPWGGPRVSQGTKKPKGAMRGSWVVGTGPERRALSGGDGSRAGPPPPAPGSEPRFPCLWDGLLRTCPEHKTTREGTAVPSTCSVVSCYCWMN
jgi:hypothetical protein